MATTMLLDGPNTVVQNTVYAIPGKSKWCLASTPLSVSTTVGGSFVAVAATTTGVLLPGACFVKPESGSGTVLLSNQ